MDNSIRADVLSNELLNEVAEMVGWTREVDTFGRDRVDAETPRCITKWNTRQMCF